MNNKIMLITYGDSMGKNLKELNSLLTEHFKREIGSVHILPFFPSSADRGFAPKRYDITAPELGDFNDIKKIAENFELMFDFMVNHISRQSVYFEDFQKNKDASEYKNFFIRYKDFWENGKPSRRQVDIIYKRKPRAPYTTVTFEDGTNEKIWCTFDEQQIDLNVNSPEVKDFIRSTLISMCENGASAIRLDAFAYAVKKPDTPCFFEEPEIWSLLEEIQNITKPYGVEILPEIHEHYTIQFKLAEKGYYIYDFALPMLMLNAIYSGNPEKLKMWFDMSPQKQFTTLDTHDGIGVVDAADLLSEKEIEQTREALFAKGANVKKIYNTEAYNNLDIYQINCTYYSALGNNDDAYLLARAVQFFAPGIPQVYYVGLLAGENDIQLLEKTKQGRDINRHYYSVREVEENIKRPVVRELMRLMRLRNETPAFGGSCKTQVKPNGILEITREHEGSKAVLTADFKNLKYDIKIN